MEASRKLSLKKMNLVFFIPCSDCAVGERSHTFARCSKEEEDRRTEDEGRKTKERRKVKEGRKEDEGGRERWRSTFSNGKI